MKNRTQQMALAGFFAALTAVGAYIRIPLPYVPFTLQLFFCCLSGALLGSRWGAISQTVYLTVGLLGVPVFAGGGGPGYIASPTFGYLIGFVAAAWIVGLGVERLKSYSFRSLFLVTFIGVLTVYLFGVPWLYMAQHLWLADPRGISWIIWYGFLTGIGGDTALAVLVALVSVRLIPLIHKDKRSCVTE